MVEEKSNVPNREDDFQHGRAEAAFYEELLCCYTCGKIFFTRHPIRLRTPSRRSFHVCLECSRSLRCFGCGAYVTSKTAVVVETPPDHLGDIFCSKCRNEVLLAFPSQSRSLGRRIRSAVASARDAFRNFFVRLGGIRFRRRNQ
jgi:hypothetical protein